ncbi:DUF2946 family protein [Asaia sp. VD9]|uniref:DUF2946 family protein n=1 Tax=Asaia sp. VD9 TaxID=3081235 RepID=UPI003017B805
MRLAVACLVLVAFALSLTLQTLAAPEETPRAEIERLIGVDIAPAMSMPDCESMPDMVMPGKTGGAQKGHHHDAACALCPLLQLSLFILGSSVFLAFATSVTLERRFRLPLSRAPPHLRWCLPPSHAPPLP